MAKPGYKSVDDYIAAQAEPVRPILEQLRAMLRRLLPDADEVIAYQIPAYKRDGIAVIYFAGWKQHLSLYPVGDSFALAYPDEAAKYSISKGTVRFPLTEKPPAKLIEKIVKLRAKEAAAEAETRATKKARKPKAQR